MILLDRNCKDFTKEAISLSHKIELIRTLSDKDGELIQEQGKNNIDGVSFIGYIIGFLNGMRKSLYLLLYIVCATLHRYVVWCYNIHRIDITSNIYCYYVYANIKSKICMFINSQKYVKFVALHPMLTINLQSKRYNVTVVIVIQ